jgi:molybdate transport system permease protein
MLIGILTVLALLFFILPNAALAIRTGQLYTEQGAITLDAFVSSLSLSVLTSLASLALIFLIGTAIAYSFTYFQFPFKSLLSVFIEMPLVMPPVVAGLALLATFGRRGLLGETLQVASISIPFTPLAVIIAQVFVAAPFYIRSLQSRLAVIPRDLLESAQMDGSTPYQVFRGILLPLSRRAILSGLLLAWARALGEFGATILFAGNLAGSTRTMPLLVYTALERDLGATYLSATVLLVLAGLVFFAVRLLTQLDAGDEDLSLR